MFPKALPEFFIKLLTEPNALVIDPFAGSNTTGKASDDLGRRWLSIERERSYLEASRYRWNEDDLI
jgi:DNA modification methylase